MHSSLKDIFSDCIFMNAKLLIRVERESHPLFVSVRLDSSLALQGNEGKLAVTCSDVTLISSKTLLRLLKATIDLPD